jgi:hypothetical protein
MRLIINLPADLAADLDPSTALDVLQQHAPTIVSDLATYCDGADEPDEDEVTENCVVEG